MAAPLFARLLRATERGAFPRTRRFIWKRVYSVLSSTWTDPGWRFMNYGWLPPEPGFVLPASEEADRAFIGLYHQAIDGLALHGARILEVGSGRGGGAAWMARRSGVAGVIGVDLSPRTVARAAQLHGNVPHLSFRVGDAEALPFPDASFDGVVNIESSHCYGSMPRFAAEVARVLKPGGWFGWADMRSPAMLPDLDRAFAEAGLLQEAEHDLTAGVVRALEATEARKQGTVARFRLVAPLLREFGGMQGSLLQGALRRRTVVYLARRYRRPMSEAVAHR
ncbi:class I SAM-dependent methyltransferase [Falsiroseomonas sp.]|uniref:class I SAM-dependent methyltransferase n=1 Tax=Falsiroseomonas sp. TaxID=2870721 RepID=UPI0034A16E32